MKNNVTIHMGASRWDALVRSKDSVVLFDLYRMSEEGRHKFRKELVKAFRIAGEQQAAA